ncbi:Lcl C-terminal domain-containing protein [Pseudorhodoferax sp.]|uniref:Lcl C-terminal domain-containing protein n=1 Tax=Pseudorhodoferax sp. TaxID=1993553 RepID=UPI002DD637F2|nr:DUF1566 domain-containing protein [Pseudorhodoferax sp.]
MNRKTPLFLAALAVACAVPVAAQTVANGPYYATPSWDQTLPVATRFIVLSNLAHRAVLDRETGLVWEREPSNLRYPQVPPAGTFGGFYAPERCLSATTGGRMGWRLPSAAELTSLMDPTQATPGLPAGHPFDLGGSLSFWSATRYFPERFPAAYRTVSSSGVFGAADGLIPIAVWCVRGGALAGN